MFIECAYSQMYVKTYAGGAELDGGSITEAHIWTPMWIHPAAYAEIIESSVSLLSFRLPLQHPSLPKSQHVIVPSSSAEWVFDPSVDPQWVNV